MIAYNKLMNNLVALKLEKFRSYLPNYVNTIAEDEIPFVDALLELTDKELEFRNERASKIQIKVSASPFEKGLDDFDFAFQPSVNKKLIYVLATLSFIEKKENILFFGPSGVAKLIYLLP